MKKIVFLFIGICLSFFGCKKKPELPDTLMLTHQAIENTIQEFRARYGAELRGFDGGAGSGLKYISISFDIPYTCTIEQARKIAVDGALFFLREINSSKELRPALVMYPFTRERLAISFYHTSEDVKEGEINDFGMRNGNIMYATSRRNVSGPSAKALEESFNTAQQKLKEAGEVTLPSFKKKELPEPSWFWDSFLTRLAVVLGNFYDPDWWMHTQVKAYHYDSGSKEDRKLKYFLDDYCHRLARANKLSFLWVGDFTDRPTTRWYPYGVTFYGNRQLTLDQSRIAFRDMYGTFLHFLQTSPTILKFQKYLNEQDSREKYSAIPDNSTIAMKITFWDKESDPQLPPYIAQIMCVDGIVRYYQAAPGTHELTMVLEERL